MGNVLTFQPSLHAPRVTAPGPEMGKLLLFTGIRYERAADTVQPDENPRGRRVRSRRRT